MSKKKLERNNQKNRKTNPKKNVHSKLLNEQIDDL